MVNSNRKGREGENRLMTFFTVRGYEAELLRLQGINDPGDLWIPELDTRVQMKNHANMLSALAEGMRNVEKLDERFPLSQNFVVVARPGRSPADWYAVRRAGAVWPAKADSEYARFHDAPSAT